jgi:hypothetical protein
MLTAPHHPLCACRDSLESNASLDNSSSRPSSFEAGKSLDEARMQVFKANRAKRVWDLQGVDPSTAVFSA